MVTSLERRIQLRAGAMQRHQHERGHQHHLEPHIEIEEVARQESAETPINRIWISGW